MGTPTDSSVLLTIRGTLVPDSLESARKLHNETAGTEGSIAAARSMGDLSHNVYSPALQSKQSGAKAGELLFLDRWDAPKGIMDFFANANVQAQAHKLFSARDAAVWMPARGAFSWHLPSPTAKPQRWVGMIRGTTKSPEEAVSIFAAVDRQAQRDARRRGLVSHELYIKMNPPGDDSPLEILGLDLWCDFAGLTEHYADHAKMSALGGAFAGPPAASVWEQAPGIWGEW